jgi:ABC-type sugar transport system substrate-binding protein
MKDALRNKGRNGATGKQLITRFVAIAATSALLSAVAIAAPAQAINSQGPLQAPDKDWKLGFSFGLDDTPIYDLVLTPAKKQARKLGVTLVEGNAKSKCETQIQDIRSMITSGVKAVTFLGLCGDGAAYDQVVAEGRKAKVVMVSYAFKHPKANGSIVFNDKQAGGEMAADAIAWAKAKFKGKYKDFSWGLLECSFAPPSIQERFKIPKKEITKATGKAPLTADCQNDPASAQKTVETWMQKDPGLDMVLGFVDSAAVGAYQAFKQAGAKKNSVYVAGIDGDNEVLELLRKGGDGIYQATYALPLTGPIQVQVPYNIINKTGASSVNLGYTGLYATNPAGVRAWIKKQITPWF